MSIILKKILYGSNNFKRCCKMFLLEDIHRNGWTFGDDQLEFPGRTKLGTLLLNKK